MKKGRRTPSGPKVEKDKIELIGTVTQTFRGGVFEVEVSPDNSDQTMKLTATLCGKMRSRYIKVTTGDSVKVELSPYDLTRGRIVYRMR
ncbi:MAG: translation initiation factor IF-1 [Polyangiaceae bacterium]|jgi:translation initiation factor IF-1|nr:translation initiation factor IF-1 [Polyangiaceae bacterium]